MAAHRRTRTYYSMTPNGMVTRDMTRRQARRVSNFHPNLAVARRMAPRTDSGLEAELARIRGLGRDEARREAAAKNIPGRRHQRVDWLRDALATNACQQAA